MERVRDAIDGRDLIDWADTDFESLRTDLNVTRLSDVSLMNDDSIYATSLPDMVRFHAQRRTSHVLVTSLDENWGAFHTAFDHPAILPIPIGIHDPTSLIDHVGNRQHEDAGPVDQQQRLAERESRKDQRSRDRELRWTPAQ